MSPLDLLIYLIKLDVLKILLKRLGKDFMFLFAQFQIKIIYSFLFKVLGYLNKLDKIKDITKVKYFQCYQYMKLYYNIKYSNHNMLRTDKMDFFIK